MDIKIEVVGKKEELEFPYVVEYDNGERVMVINEDTRYYIGYVIDTNGDARYGLNEFSKTWVKYGVVKRYKILEANYKLKEV